MTFGEWISLATGFFSIAFALILKGVDVGGFRQRVIEGERRQGETDKRLTKCESDMGMVGELKTQVAVLGAEVRGQVAALKDMSERDTRELRHDIGNIRLGMEKLTDALIGKRSS